MWPAADRECKEALCSVLQVTDRSMRAVAENCPELQFVGFMGCPVTSQGVIHLTAVSTPQISIPSQKTGLFSLLILKGLDRQFVPVDVHVRVHCCSPGSYCRTVDVKLQEVVREKSLHKKIYKDPL